MRPNPELHFFFGEEGGGEQILQLFSISLILYKLIVNLTMVVLSDFANIKLLLTWYLFALCLFNL